MFMSKKLFPLTVVLVLLLVSLGGYFWAQGALQSSYHLQAKGKKVEAEVVDIKLQRRGGAKSTFYDAFPIARYKVSGRSYLLEAPVAKDSQGEIPAVGKKVLLLYNPEEPSEAIFGGEFGESLLRNTQIKSNWFLGGVYFCGLMLLGVIFGKPADTSKWEMKSKNNLFTKQ